MKRQNKILDDVDNGYHQNLTERGHSLPLRREDYINRHTAIPHLCKRCNTVYQKIPAKALRSNSLGVCEPCGIFIKTQRKVEKGFTDFLDNLKKLPLSYLSGYENKRVRCLFECECGNRFSRAPQKVILDQSYFCKYCSKIKSAKKQSLSIKDHNLRMKERGFKSKLISKEIPNNATKLDYLCHCGEPFKRSYVHMFKKGALGCCSKCKSKHDSDKQIWSNEEYDRELSLKRPELTRIGEYLGSQIKTQHRCLCGNINWYPKPNNLFQSFDTCGCIKGSKAEKLVISIVKYLLDEPLVKTKPKFLTYPETGSRLELDGYSKKLNLAIEYDGIQHFEYNPYFHRNYQDFLSQKKRDEYKTLTCLEHGVKLIRFSGLEKRLNSVLMSDKELKDFVKEVMTVLLKNDIEIKNNPENYVNPF